jgi:ubiquinone/menaquinone biosynthesis C-methylase UbiE
VEARLQRRVQRYGWDLAAGDYEAAWQAQLAPAQAQLLAMVAPRPGEHVVDVACGTGLVSFDAAGRVGPGGRVLGTDISAGMIDAARRHAADQRLSNVGFERMDAEALDLPDASFDAALCAMGLMYMPDQLQALREMRRVLRPGGRAGLAVWGERARCGWSPVFGIVDAEVASDVCPLFFQLGQADALARACEQAGFREITQQRLPVTLAWDSGQQACDAAFAGGPVALAWSRFDAAARERARSRYLESIAKWRDGEGYRMPGEFVLASGFA